MFHSIRRFLATQLQQPFIAYEVSSFTFPLTNQCIRIQATLLQSWERRNYPGSVAGDSDAWPELSGKRLQCDLLIAFQDRCLSNQAWIQQCPDGLACPEWFAAVPVAL